MSNDYLYMMCHVHIIQVPASSTDAGGSTGGRSRYQPPRLTAAEQAELDLAKQVSQADYDNLQLYKSWCNDKAASASFKLDGSLIIAFEWQGQLHTCTRRRMDSEQVRKQSCSKGSLLCHTSNSRCSEDESSCMCWITNDSLSPGWQPGVHVNNVVLRPVQHRLYSQC